MVIYGQIGGSPIIYGQIINSDYYLSVLKRLHERICRKEPDLWQVQLWVIQYDNADSHTTITVKQFFVAKTATTVVEHDFSELGIYEI